MDVSGEAQGSDSHDGEPVNEAAENMDDAQAYVQQERRRQATDEDAFNFMLLLRYYFADRPFIYYKFITIMQELEMKFISFHTMMARVSLLFEGFPAAVQAFNSFLPAGYALQLGEIMPITFYKHETQRLVLSQNRVATLIDWLNNVKKRTCDNEDAYRSILVSLARFTDPFCPIQLETCTEELKTSLEHVQEQEKLIKSFRQLWSVRTEASPTIAPAETPAAMPLSPTAPQPLLPPLATTDADTAAFSATPNGAESAASPHLETEDLIDVGGPEVVFPPSSFTQMGTGPWEVSSSDPASPFVTFIKPQLRRVSVMPILVRPQTRYIPVVEVPEAPQVFAAVRVKKVREPKPVKVPKPPKPPKPARVKAPKTSKPPRPSKAKKRLGRPPGSKNRKKDFGESFVSTRAKKSPKVRWDHDQYEEEIDEGEDEEIDIDNYDEDDDYEGISYELASGHVGFNEYQEMVHGKGGSKPRTLGGQGTLNARLDNMQDYRYDEEGFDEEELQNAIRLSTSASHASADHTAGPLVRQRKPAQKFHSAVDPAAVPTEPVSSRASKKKKRPLSSFIDIDGDGDEMHRSPSPLLSVGGDSLPTSPVPPEPPSFADDPYASAYSEWYHDSVTAGGAPPRVYYPDGSTGATSESSVGGVNHHFPPHYVPDYSMTPSGYAVPPHHQSTMSTMARRGGRGRAKRGGRHATSSYTRPGPSQLQQQQQQQQQQQRQSLSRPALAKQKRPKAASAAAAAASSTSSSDALQPPPPPLYFNVVSGMFSPGPLGTAGPSVGIVEPPVHPSNLTIRAIRSGPIPRGAKKPKR